MQLRLREGNYLNANEPSKDREPRSATPSCFVHDTWRFFKECVCVHQNKALLFFYLITIYYEIMVYIVNIFHNEASGGGGISR